MSTVSSVPDDLIHVFADESCLGNQFTDRQNPGAAAGMIETFTERSGWRRKDYYHFEPDTTNNRMAVMSAILAVRWLRRPSRLVFTTDSQYLVRGMTQWIHAWARRGWRRKGGEIENLELWQKLASVASRHEIEWRWIRGHAAHVKNEYANALAVRSARTGTSSGGTVSSGFGEWLERQQGRGRFTDFVDLPPRGPFRPHPPPPEV